MGPNMRSQFMRARVTEQAHGFAIDTEGCDIVRWQLLDCRVIFNYVKKLSGYVHTSDRVHTK